MSSASLSTSAALPSEQNSLFVPPELLREIFTHCDVPALAAVSRTSYACLELASKLLYEDIIFRNVNAIAKILRLSTPDETTAKTSDRVSTHTSLLLVHSLTFYSEGSIDISSPSRYERLPPPLAIPVLAVSLSTRVWRTSRFEMHTEHDEDHSARGNLRELLSLFNPRIFLLRGRRTRQLPPYPDVVCLVPFSSWSLNVFTYPVWNRLSIVIQSAVDLAGGITSLCTPSDGTHATRLIWDFLDIEADPDRCLRDTFAASGLDDSVLDASEADTVRSEETRGWFGSEEIKLAFESSSPANEGAGSHAQTPILEVPSLRVRRLRDELIKHGVKKSMDWAALEEL